MAGGSKRFRRAWYPVRQTGRRVVLDVLSAPMATGLVGRTALLQTPRVQAFYLHDLHEADHDRFADLIAGIGANGSFVPLTAALESLEAAGPLGSPTFVLTFDDGLKTSVRAAELLHELEISACFYVVTGIVGERDQRRRDDFCRQRLRIEPTELMDWDDLSYLLELGHEVGSHTVSHPRLADAADQLRPELEKSFEALASRLGIERLHFAWPFGDFASAPSTVVAEATAAGYASCASAERGVHMPPVTPASLCLRRDHLLPHWPLRHVEWFMARNVARSDQAMNEFPTRPEPRR